VRKGTLKEVPRPSYSPDLAPKDIHLFGSLKQTLGGKRFRVSDEFKLLVLWLDEQPQTVLKGA
jgi:hypothetical protein